jgi:acyl-CoA dehydrogenase
VGDRATDRGVSQLCSRVVTSQSSCVTPIAWLVLTCAWLSRLLPAETARTSTSFTIFEGTSEIQRMIIGRAVTGLNVR